MQSFFDLICPDCQTEFKSATSLLQHFALHASNSLKTANVENDNQQTPANNSPKKSKLPDLYPINSVKNKTPDCKQETDIGTDSGIEDLNPLKFCLVTMDDSIKDEVKSVKPMEINRRFQCDYCPKSFGWLTHLKRHIMLHEKSFSCTNCNSTFTRNILLQKHILKFHKNYKGLPDLKPIKVKLRKQEKSKIRRNYHCATKSFEQTQCNLICTS